MRPYSKLRRQFVGSTRDCLQALMQRPKENGNRRHTNYRLERSPVAERATDPDQGHNDVVANRTANSQSA